MIELPPCPLLIVVSGPSGVGKSTLCDRLVKERPRTVYSISCTTRPPRAGEVDGREYHFLSEDEFARRVDAGEFAEHAVVHGARYGTLAETLRSEAVRGHDVVMDIDVQGAAQLRSRMAAPDARSVWPGAYLDVFIAPPTWDELADRLRGRATDGDDVIARRLDRARAELDRWSEYQYLIVNREREDSYRQLDAVLTAESLRVREGDRP